MFQSEALWKGGESVEKIKDVDLKAGATLACGSQCMCS